MDTKFKDCLPLETVRKIKDILVNYNIDVEELPMTINFDRFYSVRIVIRDTDIGTNGKGLSPEYALASAYGEFVERLQNGMLLANNDKLNFNDSSDGEIKISLSSNINTPLITDVIDDLGNRPKLINLWVANNKNSDEFLGYKYFSLLSTDYAILPNIMKIAYGSNGMAAGNSYEEAIVQACSEIFERYVAKKVINGEIVPPDIDVEELNTIYPDIREYIDCIKSKGDYNIIIKDCSLGEGFPVLALCIINRSTGKYYLNFGAHPCISIALERMFTEIFQGKSINDMKMEIQADVTEYLGNNNYLSFFRNGCAYFSNKFLDSKSDYVSSIKHFDFQSKNNIQLLEYIKNFLKQKNLSAYIRYSGQDTFPSVHVIIPSLSKIFEQDEIALKYRMLRNYAKENIKNYSLICNNDKELLLYFVDYSRKVHYGHSFLETYFKKSIEFNGSNFLRPYMLFLLFGYLHIGKDKEALKICRSIIKKTLCEETLMYFKALEYYIVNKNNLIDVTYAIFNVFPSKIYDLLLKTLEPQWFQNNILAKVLK